MGDFDIEVARLWDDDLIERIMPRSGSRPDFDKGLAVARTRHPQPQAESTSQLRRRLQRSSPSRRLRCQAGAARYHSSLQPPPAPPGAASPQPLPIEPPKQESPDLQMKSTAAPDRAPLARLDEENMRKRASLPPPR